ncbi:HlyD family efflux transporter periplasmic adaptor subunit [Pseudomonas sp. App30]|uniref:HlyD family secretion protein n=1 Tax=Pseudomonas sp. App30 TaxID=3068990 RepID=UPI003A7FF5DA
MSSLQSPMADSPAVLDTSAAEPGQGSSRRKSLLLVLGAVVVLCALGYAAYWYFIGSRYVSTDNAYTGAESASITPAVSGIVQSVPFVDTANVHKGDVLIAIDDTDARLAVEQAQADYDSAVRKVRGYLANDAGLTAQVQARAADERRMSAQITSAKADYDRALLDLGRRQVLVGSGSVSGEELSNARTTLATAKASLEAAQASKLQAVASRQVAIGSLDANKVLIADTTVATNPEVLHAKARLEQALVDLDRTRVRAPVDGVVANRQVQVGQRVQPGMTLLTVVPIDSLHVDANFKEVQLSNVRIGQTVSLVADLYGSDVVYHGVVAGFSGGSGSSFAMIPAQNATGNWIKVVQRLPVRVSLDAKELHEHPLGIGLSMDATIDTQSVAVSAH